jgi:UDP-3-O-acyl-N-acetylglucosamine deacetylase
MVRFLKDEAARHTMVDLIGDLSLNAAPGHSGLPVGHIIAYKVTGEKRLCSG